MVYRSAYALSDVQPEFEAASPLRKRVAEALGLRAVGRAVEYVGTGMKNFLHRRKAGILITAGAVASVAGTTAAGAGLANILSNVSHNVSDAAHAVLTHGETVMEPFVSTGSVVMGVVGLFGLAAGAMTTARGLREAQLRTPDAELAENAEPRGMHLLEAKDPYQLQNPFADRLAYNEAQQLNGVHAVPEYAPLTALNSMFDAPYQPTRADHWEVAYTDAVAAKHQLVADQAARYNPYATVTNDIQTSLIVQPVPVPA